MRRIGDEVLAVGVKMCSVSEAAVPGLSRYSQLVRDGVAIRGA